MLFYDISIPDNLEEQLQHVQEADNFISLLHEYSGMGAAMRHVMTSAFVNQQVFLKILSYNDHLLNVVCCLSFMLNLLKYHQRIQNTPSS